MRNPRVIIRIESNKNLITCTLTSHRVSRDSLRDQSVSHRLLMVSVKMSLRGHESLALKFNIFFQLSSQCNVFNSEMGNKLF